MRNFMTLCILTFLIGCPNIVSAANIDLTSRIGPDPWLTYYGRFATRHTECRPVSGNILIQPQYTRELAYYDDTQADPMVLSSDYFEGNPEFRLSNNSCRMIVGVNRTLGWDEKKYIAPSRISKNNNILRVENPAMLAEILYENATSSCTQFSIPFMANSENVSFTQSDSFRSGYKIIAKDVQDKRFRILSFIKYGCEIDLRLSMQVSVDGKWIYQLFQ